MTRTMVVPLATISENSEPKPSVFRYAYTVKFRLDIRTHKEINGIVKYENAVQPPIPLILARLVEHLHEDGAFTGAKNLSVRVYLKKGS